MSDLPRRFHWVSAKASDLIHLSATLVGQCGQNSDLLDSSGLAVLNFFEVRRIVTRWRLL